MVIFHSYVSLSSEIMQSYTSHSIFFPRRFPTKSKVASLGCPEMMVNSWVFGYWVPGRLFWSNPSSKKTLKKYHNISVCTFLTIQEDFGDSGYVFFNFQGPKNPFVTSVPHRQSSRQHDTATATGQKSQAWRRR